MSCFLHQAQYTKTHECFILQAFGFQLANGVPIESWYDDDSDDELLRMLPFLESLVDVPDVRPYIINAFKLHTLVDQAPGYSWS